jgi:hypothetical protein
MNQMTHQIAFRVTPTDLEEIDELGRRLVEIAPRFTSFARRSDVVRYLLSRGIESVEKELEKGKP